MLKTTMIPGTPISSAKSGAGAVTDHNPTPTFSKPRSAHAGGVPEVFMETVVGAPTGVVKMAGDMTHVANAGGATATSPASQPATTVRSPMD